MLVLNVAQGEMKVYGENIHNKVDVAKKSNNRFLRNSLAILLAGSIATYSLFQERLPERYKFENVRKEAIGLFDTSRELIRQDDGLSLVDIVDKEIPEGSIDRILVQWNRTKYTEFDYQKVRYDIGEMFLFDDGELMDSIHVVGGIYEDEQENYYIDGHNTSPHDGTYDLGFYVEKPELHTQDGFYPSGSDENPFGDGMWTMFIPGNGEYERIQIHGIRPKNEKHEKRLFPYFNLGPTNGCIRMSNDNIRYSSKIFSPEAVIEFTTKYDDL